MANYKQKLAIQYAAEGRIEELKSYHMYNDGANLLYYAVKNKKLECAKYILSIYPNSKISCHKLASLLIKCDDEMIIWAIESNISNTHNNELLYKFTFESINRNFILTPQKSLRNIRLARNLGFDTDKPINAHWPSNSTGRISSGITNVLRDYKVIKRLNKLSKING